MHYKKILFISVILLVSLFVNAQTDWKIDLKNSIQPIQSVELSSNNSDLKSILPYLKDKRVIGFGEATHGTHEFFEMKAKAFRFLVENAGVRNFGIEASFSGATALNDYVMFGKGDKYEALHQLEFWTWDVKEVIELVDWMRLYNSDKADKDKIHFYGFDMQITDYPFERIKEYLIKVDSNEFDKTKIWLAPFDSFAFENKWYQKKINENDYQIAESSTVELEKYFLTNKEGFISKSSNKEFAIALKHINILNQAVRLRRVEDTNMTLRDSLMAVNIKWILDYEGDSSKIFLWAHNEHITKGYTWKWKRMGNFIKDIYHEKYYSLGFIFNQGNFQAKDKKRKGVSEFTLPPDKLGIAVRFSEINTPIFFLDFNNALIGKGLLTLLNSEIPYYDIGSVFLGKKKSRNFTPLTQQFDGIIFIDKTTRAQPNEEYY